MLQLDGDDLTGLPYTERRARLDALTLSDRHGAPRRRSAEMDPEVMAACTTLGLEGVVAKRLSSVYRPGHRSKDWVTLKCSMWRTLRGPPRHEPPHAATTTGLTHSSAAATLNIPRAQSAGCTVRKRLGNTSRSAQELRGEERNRHRQHHDHQHPEPPGPWIPLFHRDSLSSHPTLDTASTQIAPTTRGAGL